MKSEQNKELIEKIDKKIADLEKYCLDQCDNPTVKELRNIKAGRGQALREVSDALKGKQSYIEYL